MKGSGIVLDTSDKNCGYRGRPGIDGWCVCFSIVVRCSFNLNDSGDLMTSDKN